MSFIANSPRYSFLSSLIPPTPEQLKDVLVQGGLSYSMASLEDTPFLQLVEETRDFISSADFGKVLEVCLDNATDVMFDGLRRSLFPAAPSEVPQPPQEKIRFAGLLPGIARWSHAAVNGTPNELVEVSYWISFIVLKGLMFCKGVTRRTRVGWVFCYYLFVLYRYTSVIAMCHTSAIKQREV